MKKRLPNILITIADDQRGSALGCAGIEPVITPHLDALAARGTRYANAQHLGSNRLAVCAPSRAMLHTGYPYFQLDPSLLGPLRSPPEQPTACSLTLGERLQSAGYHCFATGKWHNGTHSFSRSFTSGQNIFFGGLVDHFFAPVYDFDPTGEYPPERVRMANGFSTEVFAQSMITFLQSRQDVKEPFFAYCAFTAPHDPRTPPDYWRKQYKPSDIPLPPNIPITEQKLDAPPGIQPFLDNDCLSVRDELLLGTPRDAAEIRRSIAEYYGMVSHMDEWIGRIYQTLSDIGQLNNTIIVHTADHGLSLGQHGLLGKQNLYQPSLQVPLILAGPGITANSVSHALCYQHDLHPTLLEAAGLSASHSPFRSLSSQSRQSIASAFRNEQRSIRNARYKLIEYNLKKGRRTELYDLTEDPWEIRDLSQHPEMKKIILDLRRSLREWQDVHGDTANWVC